MPKTFFCIRSVSSTLFFVLLSAVFSFGQSSDLQTDLDRTFKKYSLNRLNNQKNSQSVESQRRLSIQTAERTFELNLTPRDLRSTGYLARDTNSERVQTIGKAEVTTFKGTVEGESDSEVRVSINGEKIEGFFDVGDEKFFIEPARNYSRLAAAEDVLIYKAGDLLENHKFLCDSELSDRIERGKEMVKATAFETASNLRVVELATEADYQYVLAVGGAAQANSEILSTLNMVEGTFQRELNLSISVVFQHTWSAPDPFDGTNSNTLLISFKDYWNANFPAAQFPRDAAHLFSGKPTVSGLGLAYTGVVCINPNFAYGLSGRTVSAVANALITAHETAHNLGAHHAEAEQSCANTIMNTALTDQTPMTFCAYSRSEITAYVAANGNCLSERIPSRNVRFDFDGDGKADIAVWRPSNGVWYITNSRDGSFNFVQFGTAGDKPVPADYDGDGRTDIAVYRGGVWYRLKSADNTFDSVSFGNLSDTPVPADYDGDGRADIAVYRPSEGVWHRLLSGSNNLYSSVQFGGAGDIPLPADYDGDGRADINVWRADSGVWYRLNSATNNSFYATQFGAVGDKPLTADFDGDGKSDAAVFRPINSTWYIIKSGSGSLSGTSFGSSGDVPIPADYDGDGRADVSVFRLSNGYWYRLNSSNGFFATAQFGAFGDFPIPSF